MSSLTFLAAAAPTRLDPIRLFLDADLVVQLVMAGLLLASIWVWMIIVSFSLRMRKLRSRTIEYESEFWQAESFDRFTSERGSKDIPAARVAQAAVSAYPRSTQTAVVGLFGTVWGIMNSCFQIGAQESSSLAVVAPGISEALFATAIGLFAAIPAVIAYNRFGHRVDRYEARLQRFADKLNATFSRQLETR